MSGIGNIWMVRRGRELKPFVVLFRSAFGRGDELERT